MYDGTGDTITCTVAGAAPANDVKALVPGECAYMAVFVAPASGSQTVAISGGDAGDDWSCGFKGYTSVDQTTPWDGEITDTASPGSISVTTTSDGLAIGVAMADDASLATTDTEVFEGPEGPNLGMIGGCASSAGTGGSVSLDWTVSGTIGASCAANLRHTSGAPGAPGPGLTGATRVALRGVGRGLYRSAR